jgi:hypothetical protein
MPAVRRTSGLGCAASWRQDGAPCGILATMRCSRGEASPDEKTKRELWASCGGYCQRPECRTSLFVEMADRARIAIGEMAHVFAASDAGPRQDPQMTKAERGAFDNLIMLCPTCHTLVDKSEDRFPDATILSWKREHMRCIADVLGTPTFDSRASARRWLEERLRANRIVHQQYGPHGEHRFDPESELAGVWRRKVVEHIIPVNRRILAALDANTELLRPGERDVRERLRQHVDDLESFHIWGIESARQRFPPEVNEVLID